MQFINLLRQNDGKIVICYTDQLESSYAHYITYGSNAYDYLMTVYLSNLLVQSGIMLLFSLKQQLPGLVGLTADMRSRQLYIETLIYDFCS